MAAKRLVVTGGSGFIGTAIVEAAVARGDAVLNFDIAPPRNPAHAPYWRRTDLLDRVGLDAALAEARADAVIHMAARTDLGGRSVDDYSVNVAGVANLIAATADTPRVVLASSMLVCALGHMPAGPDDYRPSTVYGESKVLGERLVRSADPDGRRLVLVRPTSIWGPWFATPYRDFFAAVRRGLYVHPAGAATRRSYGFVRNTAAQVLALTDAPPERLAAIPYYLADPEPVDILAWANEIAAASGRGPVKVAPLALIRAAAAAGDAAQRLGWRSPPMTGFRLRNMLMSAVYDTGPIAALCPAPPVPRRVGVAETVAWMDRDEKR